MNTSNTKINLQQYYCATTGTAAYKTVELDTYLGDAPIQHREVQGHESLLFKSYFESITLLKGGADTGFRRVLPEKYEPRLFHIEKQSNRKITCVQKPMKKGNLEVESFFFHFSSTRRFTYFLRIPFASNFRPFRPKISYLTPPSISPPFKKWTNSSILNSQIRSHLILYPFNFVPSNGRKIKETLRE